MKNYLIQKSLAINIMNFYFIHRMVWVATHLKDHTMMIYSKHKRNTKIHYQNQNNC